MKRYLVISYSDATIEVEYVAKTFEEAREFMIADVQNYINTIDTDYGYNDGFGDDYAFVEIYGDGCDWVIKEIEV